MSPIKPLFKKLINMFIIKKPRVLTKEEFNKRKLEKHAKPHSIIRYNKEGYITSIDGRIFLRPKVQTDIKSSWDYRSYKIKFKNLLYDPWIIGILLILLQTLL